jgi:hypothetical protein
MDMVEWRKASFSGDPANQCVEVSLSTNTVGVRDSKNADGPILKFDHGEWTAFLVDLAR